MNLRTNIFSRSIIVATAGVMLFVTACSKQDTAARVYGKIGFNKITQAQLDRTKKFLSRTSPSTYREYEGEAGLEKLLTRHIEDVVFMRDAQRLGIHKTPAITNELRTYKQYLILQKYEKDILLARAGITEKEYKAYYNAHREEYQINAQVLAKHILCANETDAKKVLTELQAGKSFDDLVDEFSLDRQTKKNKGRLGWVSQGKSIPFLGKRPALSEALFTLKVGIAAGPIKTDRGYHIIQIDEQKPATYKELNAVRTQIQKAIFTTDANMQEFYTRNKANFTIPATRTVSHILVNTQKVADKVIAKLNRGARFEKIVRQYSTCPVSKNKKGFVGNIRIGNIIPVTGERSTPFTKTVFTMKQVGDIAGPVKTSKGWHVIKLDNIIAPQAQTFEAVQQQIRTQLLLASKKEGRKKAIKALENDFKVVRNKDIMSDIPAHIGSRKVTNAALEITNTFHSKITPASRRMYEGNAGRVALLNKHIEDKIIFLDGLKKGFENDDVLVSELEQYERFLTLREYSRQVLEARAGMQEKEFKAYYRLHQDEFNKNGTALVKHILCNSAPDAEKVLAEIKKGMSFDTAVTEYTTHTITQTTKGLLGTITEDGNIPYLGKLPKLTRAVFNGPIGKAFGPIKTSKGFHILFVNSKKPGTLQPLAKIHTQVRDALLTKEEYLKEYYEKHKEEYFEAERRNISHIQCKTERQGNKVLSLLQKGGDFATLANRYSTNKTSGEKGGLIGNVRKGSYIHYIGSNEHAFENAAFALAKPGDYSALVTTQKNDYHIIYLNTITPALQKSFEDIRLTIKSRVLNLKKKEGIEAYKERIMKKARVVIFEIERTEKELFDLAQKSLEDRDYDKAIKYYQRIYEDYPKGDKAYQAYFLVGWVYSEYLKAYDEADSYFNIVLDKFADSDLADDAEWMLKNQRNPNALDFIIKKAEQTEAAAQKKGTTKK